MEETQTDPGQTGLDARQARNTRTRVCKRCKFSTSDAKEFLHHQITVHDEDLEVHTCDKCEFVSTSYTELVCHKRNHRRSSGASVRQLSTDSETGTCVCVWRGGGEEAGAISLHVLFLIA